MFFLRKRKKTLKLIAVFLLLNMVVEIIAPTAAYALTGGPSQPEVQSFSPVGTSEMVDMGSGDFTYNIPLLDVGGYPINITYNAGITPDQEASWVGMGWNINPGVVNRSVRGLPDDFNGDKITKEYNTKPNKTYGATLGARLEFIGLNKKKQKTSKGGVSFSLGVKYNNYTGYSADLSLSPNLSVGVTSKSKLNIGLGLSASSSDGAEISPNVNFSYSNAIKDKEQNLDLSIGVGVSMNSRQGLTSLTIDPSAKVSKNVEVKDKPGITDKGKAGGYNFGSTISFSNPSHTPYSDMPYVTKAYSLSASVGGEVKWLNITGNIRGHYSENKLTVTNIQSDAYGYLYSQNGNKHNSLHDFNREKDSPIQTSSPNLGLGNYTYDVYSLSGQGIGGVFRPCRTDIGMLYNPKVINGATSSFSLGAEVGVGSYFKLGADVNKTKSTSYDGGWFTDNDLYSKISYRGVAYMKAAGEKTINANPEYFAKIGGYEAVRPHILGSKEFSKTDPVLVSASGVRTSIDENTLRNNQQPVTQNVLMLTQAEAASFGLMKQIENHYTNNFVREARNMSYSPSIVEKISRVNNPGATYQDHHIGEIVSTRPDGSRYVYSIPAYNKKQKEVTFAIGNVTPDNFTGLVDYNTEDKDNTTNNKKGQDSYFEAISTPGFAHSYLLTAIISADYVDRTGDGPTDDDNGSYTKINYTRAVPNFNWRTPVQKNKASHNEGLKSNRPSVQKESDDKGNYIYGEKELWYVHSIETRTHLAQFHLENRDDGLGVIDENGGINTNLSQSPKKLVKISLYAKTQVSSNVPTTASRIAYLPIKEVNFIYDYSICKNVPNNILREGLPSVYSPNNTLANGGGKLTLREIYFTYGASGKGKFSSYKFKYAGAERMEEDNPELVNMNNYNIKDYDRWGNYKPNANPDVLTSSEFPYTLQDKSKTDLYATLWNLNNINLPSGGSIKVDYESDDYAYVQNRNAMQMFMVTGMANKAFVNNTTKELPSDKIVYDRLINTDKSPNNLVVFKLAQPIVADAAQAKKIVERDYLKNMNNMYFRFSVRMGNNEENFTYEFVPGYVELVSNGLIASSNGTYTHAWVEMKGVGIKMGGGGGLTNPISRAAWQFAQLYLPRYAYSVGNATDPTSSGVLQALEAIVDALGSITQAFKGINKTMRDNDKGVIFQADRSWIRLYNPDGKKLGGGHRVKKVELTDNWKQLAGSQYSDASYGQIYEYTKEIDLEGGGKRTISSGVAAYEPMLGGDENPFREPVKYRNPDKYLAPRRDYYMEKPFGESFFPGPSIVYSKVKVKSIKEGTGYVVHEHYTQQDFPTIVSQTYFDVLSRLRGKPSTLLKILKIKNYDFLTVSQGYCIILNDMHGKPKAQTVYPQNGDVPISRVEYKYKSKEVPYTYKVSLPSGILSHTLKQVQLDNQVRVVHKNAVNGFRIGDAEIGLEYDIAYDSRESFSKTSSPMLQINLDTSPPIEPLGIPLPIPPIIPGLQKERTRFRSGVITKVINQYGILDETIATEDGASVSTKNLLYDAQTGEVLLTETTNQFSDPVFSFTYPAHWAYDGMGPAYKNTGFATDNIARDYYMFVPGDELAIQTAGGSTIGWVVGVTPGNVQIVDRSGNTIGGVQYAKVIRSGRRNMQSVPVGTVTTLQNPIVNGELAFARVLNAGAVEFDESWRSSCDNGLNPDQQNFNPYIEGTRGNWRMKRSYVYLTQRTQSTDNNNTNIRKDGVFESFSPFWVAPQGAGSGDWAKNTNRWQYTSEVTKYSSLGYELENVDALNRYSSALYGYLGATLPIAVANNARYGEIAFENFDDYFGYINTLKNRHLKTKASFGFNQSGRIRSDVFHTGKSSLQVFPSKTFVFENIIINCQ